LRSTATHATSRVPQPTRGFSLLSQANQADLNPHGTQSAAKWQFTANKHPLPDPTADPNPLRRSLAGKEGELSIPLDPKLELAQFIVSQFPKVDFAMAYGSLAIPQLPKTDSNGKLTQSDPDQMLDFIFAVNNPKVWHEENLELNPKHYSFVRHMGVDAIVKLQRAGPGIYYNTRVNVQGPKGETIKIKYGVIETTQLCRDLIRWDSLYVSGRMQKPVLIVESNTQLKIAMNYNLHQAAAMALLQLPERFTEAQFYETVAGLSYEGDPRMKLGAEPTDKIKRLVHGALPSYRELYQNVLRLYINAGENKEFFDLCELQAKHKEVKRGPISFPLSIDQDILGMLTSGSTKLRQPVDTVSRCRLLMQTPLALHIAMYQLSVEDAGHVKSKIDVPRPPQLTLDDDRRDINRPFWENFPFGFLAPEPAPSAPGQLPRGSSGNNEEPEPSDGPGAHDPPPGEVPPPDSDDRRGRERGPRGGIPEGSGTGSDTGDASYHFNDSSGYRFDIEGWSHLANISRQNRLTDLIKRGIAKIVNESATIQTAKGLLTGGVLNSLWYATSKIKRSR